MADFRPLSDQSHRDRIATELDSSLLVEAAAGTGKTTSMVARMTALLREGAVSMRHIAAMTFTVKAAGHLRQKFDEALRTALHEESNDIRRKRLAEALDDIDLPFIGTIHAFCAGLLRERPLEAGVDPDFIVMDEEEESQLRARVFHDVLRASTDPRDDIPTLLSDSDLPVAALEHAYAQLCRYEDVQFATQDVPPPAVGPALAKLQQLCDILLPHLPDKGSGVKEDALQKTLRNYVRQLPVDDNDAAAAARLLESFRKGGALVTLRAWKQSGLDAREEVKIPVEEFADQYVRPALLGWQHHLYPRLLRAALSVVDRFTEEKQRRGLLGNNDLLLRTRDMLRAHPGVRSELQQRYRRILVDEFQDTDPVQAEILLYLTGDNIDEQDWMKLRPRPGSLFVVGDPRQSIYRFRRADVSVYNAVAAIMEATSAKRLHLTTSFRSLPAVCDWINTRFSQVFPHESTPFQAADAPIATARADAGALCGVYGFPMTYASMRTPSDMLAAEAEEIAAWVANAVAAGATIRVRDHKGQETERPMQPKDVLLLTAVNAGIDTFASALEQRGIPVTITGGYALRDAETLTPVMHLLHALADPLDEISVVAFLRGPFCGADDAALASYRSGGGRFTFFSTVLKGADQRILDGMAFIKGKVRLLRSLPPAAVVGSMFEELGLLAWTAASERGNLRAGTLQRLVEFVQHASARGAAFAEIVRRLDAAMEASRIDGMPLLPDENALRIMNVHKAKGLEAPVVILARHSTAKTGTDRETVCIDRTTQPALGVMRILHTYPGGGNREVARAQGWDLAMDWERRHLEAERQRLQYVAATRAEAVLIVSMRTNASTTPDTWDTLLPGIARDLHRFEALPSKAPSSAAEDLPSPVEADRDMTQRRTRAAAATYALQSPSRISGTHVQETTHSQGTTGDGRAFGSAAHRLLEAAVRSNIGDGKARSAAIAAEESLPTASEALLVEMFTVVRSHPLWRRICSAERRFPELPFGDILEGDLPIYMHGVIDIVFEDEDGWTIVDYKTDLVSEESDPRVDGYRMQIAAYRESWERITGTSARAYLWFVRTGLVVE